MEVFLSILSVVGILSIATIFGKAVSKVHLPSILGMLIAGMLFGPHMVGSVKQTTIDSTAYTVFIKILEGFAGVMIGSEIIFSDLKKYGTKTLVITAFQSLGTFALVSACFAIVFAIMDIPLYMALIFGGIALATAPAPVLSIIREYKAEGPVTRTLIPLAVIDDIIGIAVFFTVITCVASSSNVPGMEPWKIILSVLYPILAGCILGFLFGFFSKKVKNNKAKFVLFLLFLLLGEGTNFLFDFLLFHSILMNYILLGVFYSLLAVNTMEKEEKPLLLKRFSPILNFSLLCVIVNLGMTLDLTNILSSGIFTLVYILSRAIGKISFSYVGGKITKSEKSVTRYLGLTLLPHSGVSLIFTGIAAGVLVNIDPALATMLQGAIASAAVINEIIAVILAKIGLQKAGEIPSSKKQSDPPVKAA